MGRAMTARQDHHGSEQTQSGPGQIPAIRWLTFDDPEPGERGHDVDAPISGVGSTGQFHVDARE